MKMSNIKDSLEALNGRWKLSIMHSVLFGAKRFKQISRKIDGSTDKMLSKALKEATRLFKEKYMTLFHLQSNIPLLNMAVR
jgi:DNA-binding HxlR family transcriptional regulator